MSLYLRPFRERKRRFSRGAVIGLFAAGLLCQAVFAAGLTGDEKKEPIPEAQACILYHGEPIPITAEGETVAEAISRLDLNLGEEDCLSLPVDAVIETGTLLRIDCIRKVEQIYSVPLPGQVVDCLDVSMPDGTSRTLIPGRDGELLRTAEVTYRNGREIHREILTESVHISPVNTVIAHGREVSQPPEGLRIDDSTITLPTGEVLTYTHTVPVRATAYTHTDKGCNMVTATGTKVHVGTVAVDPRYIPYGTRMFIMASDGSYTYGIAEAEDCGGDIIGDRMDLYLPTYEACMEFGRRVCTVYFLG